MGMPGKVQICKLESKATHMRGMAQGTGMMKDFPFVKIDAESFTLQLCVCWVLVYSMLIIS
jgi:hypothetical protein